MLALGCLQIGRIAARPKAPGEQQPRTRAAADKQLATGQPLWFFFTARHALHGRVIEWDCAGRSEEHTSELQSLMRISYAVFCLKKKTSRQYDINITHNL